MVDPLVVSGFAGAIAKSSLVNTLRDRVVNFLADKAKGIAGDELKGRIESLRSDAKLNKQIQGALERAAKRWAELPARFEEERIERNVSEFLNSLREEFISITALQPTLQTFAGLNTANATAVLSNIERLLEQLLNRPSATEETPQNYLTWVIDQHRYLDPKGIYLKSGG